MKDIRKLIDAIRKNGYRKTTGKLFRIKYGQIYACALGQAAINLGYVSEGAVQVSWDAEKIIAEVKRLTK